MSIGSCLSVANVKNKQNFNFNFHNIYLYMILVNTMVTVSLFHILGSFYHRMNIS